MTDCLDLPFAFNWALARRAPVCVFVFVCFSLKLAKHRRGGDKNATCVASACALVCVMQPKAL